MNRLWTRVFLAGALALILLFFCNDFGIIDIQKTAIVVAIGVDKSQTDENAYDVTAQIAIPVSSGSSGADAACQITVKNAKTIGEAVAKVNSETGWFPTLVYCRLVLFSKDAVERNVFDALDYFLRSNFVPDTALVAVVEERCEKVLSSKSPINDMSSTAITKTLSSEAQKSGTVLASNLRDFAKGYYSPSSSGALPFIQMKTSSEEQSDAGSSGKSQQSFIKADGDSQTVAKTKSLPFAVGYTNPLSKLSNKKFKRWRFAPIPLPLSSSASSGGKSQEKPNVFNASKTALFKDGVMVATLDEEQTLALNLATANIKLATFEVPVEKESRTYVLQVKTEKQKQKLKIDEDKNVFKISIECSAEIIDASKATDIEDITKSQLVKKDVLVSAETYLTEKLKEVFEKARESKADVFGIQQNLYRYCYKHYERLKDGILNSVFADYDIKFINFR